MRGISSLLLSLVVIDKEIVFDIAKAIVRVPKIDRLLCLVDNNF